MLGDQKVIQVRIGGFGGQGVVLAGALLGYAAVRDGLWVSGSNSYGAQARGGAARSEVVISNGPIAFPHVLQADVLVAMSQSAYDAFSDNLAEQDPVVIHDPGLVAPRSLEAARQVPLPATEAAVSELGNKQVANIVMLGALSALTEIVSIKALETAVSEQVSSRFRDLNLQALSRGFELGVEAQRIMGYGAGRQEDPLGSGCFHGR
ncbi:MAG: 2-oxoacid:acceptor oxidoreductase family protein [Thermodesulfobacteriota bacterium]